MKTYTIRISNKEEVVRCNTLDQAESYARARAEKKGSSKHPIYKREPYEVWHNGELKRKAEGRKDWRREDIKPIFQKTLSVFSRPSKRKGSK